MPMFIFIFWLFSWLDIWSLDGENCRSVFSNVSFCPQAKVLNFTDGEDERNDQTMFTFKLLESDKFDLFASKVFN